MKYVLLYGIDFVNANLLAIFSQKPYNGFSILQWLHDVIMSQTHKETRFRINTTMLEI